MIDDIVVTYEKTRKNFGKPPTNTKEEATAIGGIPHDESRKGLYVQKTPKNITLSNIPEYSEHGVLTAT